MTVPEATPPDSRRRGARGAPALQAVPTEGFTTLAAIEMESVIRYLEQVVKRADPRFLRIIPPDQVMKLRALAPRVRALLDIVDPLAPAPAPAGADGASGLTVATVRRVATRPEKRKLTDAQVRQIRSRYAAGELSQRKLSKEYGVHQSEIFYIIHRKFYRDVLDG